MSIHGGCNPASAGSGGAGLTDTELRASPVSVSGPLTDAELRAAALSVLGPLTQAELEAIIVAIAGNVAITNFPASQSVDVSNFPATQPVSIASTIKNEEREAGYANVSLYAEAVAGLAVETAISLNKSVAFGAPAAATSNGASVNKELVLLGMILGWVATTTTANTCRLRLRVNPAGAAIISSPIAFTCRIGWESATFIANEEEMQPILFAKPLIIPNPGQLMATQLCAAANGTLDLQLLAYERTP